MQSRSSAEESGNNNYSITPNSNVRVQYVEEWTSVKMLNEKLKRTRGSVILVYGPPSSSPEGRSAREARRWNK